MTTRLAARFTALRTSGRSALVPYLTAGDPAPSATVDLLHALVRGGADVLELGVPFSDPMADGPVIQQACERALARGTTLAGVLGMVRGFRRTDTETPLVLMSYLNPIERRGMAGFARAAARAGVDGVLVVDQPVEEVSVRVDPVRAAGLDRIFLLSPTSSAARARAASRAGSGYLYYVALKGVTGAGGLDPAAVGRQLRGLRRVTRLPIAVGFGIRDPDSARRVGRVADGVVIGSALVETVGRHRGTRKQLAGALQRMLRRYRRALEVS